MHTLIDQRRPEIAALCRRYAVRRLAVFGSAARGTDFDRGSVTIDSKTVSAPRTIGKGDLEKLHAVWDDYRAHRIERGPIAQISQNSSYVFAIFRWRADSHAAG